MSIIRTPLTVNEAIDRIRADYPNDGNVMAANYDPNGEEGEWDGLTVDDIETWTDNATGLVDHEGFGYWGPFELWLESAPDALDIITTVLTDTPDNPAALAKAILVALENAGFVVLDQCARCGEDPRAHWCADLEETFN